MKKTYLPVLILLVLSLIYIACMRAYQEPEQRS